MLQKSGYLSTRPRLAENKPRGQTFRRFCQPAAAAGDHRGTAAVPSHPRYSPKRMRSAARERRMCAVVRRTASGQTMLFSLQRIAGAAGSAGTHAHGCRRGGARRPFASPSGVHRFGVRSRTTRLVGAPNILTRCMSMSRSGYSSSTALFACCSRFRPAGSACPREARRRFSRHILSPGLLGPPGIEAGYAS